MGLHGDWVIHVVVWMVLLNMFTIASSWSLMLRKSVLTWTIIWYPYHAPVEMESMLVISMKYPSAEDCCTSFTMTKLGLWVWALKVNGDHSRRWDLRHQFRSAILGSWLPHYAHTSLGDGEILSFLVKHRILCCLCFKDMKGVQKENLQDMGGGQVCVFDEHVRHIFSSLWCINDPNVTEACIWISPWLT